MFMEQKVPMTQILASLNLVQIVSRIILLSKLYLRQKSEGLKLKQELTVLFLQRLLRMNKKLF